MSMHAPYHQENPAFAAIAGLYPRPRSKRVFLHQPADVCIVEARPDLTFLIKDAVSPQGDHPLAGFGFLIGAGKHSAPIDAIARSFAQQSIPVLSQSLLAEGIRWNVSALCLDKRLILRVTAVNVHPLSVLPARLFFSTIQTSLGELYEHPNEDYVPFQNDPRPWLAPLAVELAGGAILHRGLLRALVLSLAGFGVEALEAGPGRLIAFAADLPPGAQASLELVIPYAELPPGEEDALRALRALRWQSALVACLAFYQGHLTRGTRLRTPEAEVNRLFDTLRLSTLQMLGSKACSPVLYPGQGGMNPFGTVYGMEATAWLPMLARLGYTAEVERVTEYLLSTQSGSPGPAGDISDPAGSFRPHIHWMCETGAVLTLLCSYGLYTQDEAWFGRVAGQLQAACAFIIRERARTKAMYAPDEAGHGLLPAGRPHDWPDFGQFLFSDAYTWRGLRLAADVFAAFRHPQAQALRAEVEDYRRCILASFRKAVYPHPQEPGRLWFSNEVHTPAGVEVGAYGGDGPICLVHAGVLPSGDPLVPQIEWDSQRRGFMTPLFAHIMPAMEDEQLGALQRRHAGGGYDMIYVTFSEIMWHKVFMQRGERGRALTYLYSTLAYATTYDLGLTAERYIPQLPWLLPWQPNASANGRILEMVISSICFAEEDCLYLFAGVPPLWLEETILLEEYAIQGGSVSLNSTRQGERLVISAAISRGMPAILPRQVVYCLPAGWEPLEASTELVKDEMGWYRAPLEPTNRTVFRRLES
jgi:hypothetical protein